MQLLTVIHVNQMPLSVLVPNYLMASYLYEHEHECFMDDSAYDRLCARLDEHFDEIQHRHKHLVERQSLSATTGYYIRLADYPAIVVHTARILANAAKTDKLYSFRIQEPSNLGPETNPTGEPQWCVDTEPACVEMSPRTCSRPDPKFPR